MKWKEVAKFACGAEAFHTVVHAYLWLSGNSLALPVFGITTTPRLNLLGFIVNAVVSLALGIYGWRR